MSGILSATAVCSGYLALIIRYISGSFLYKFLYWFLTKFLVILGIRHVDLALTQYDIISYQNSNQLEQEIKSIEMKTLQKKISTLHLRQ